MQLIQRTPPKAPNSGDQGVLHHWATWDNFHIRPYFQYYKMQVIYLKYRNKHKDLDKMRRKRNMF